MKLTITLSGFHGTGKSTYARIIAKNFNLRHVSAGGLFRQIAKEKGLSISELSQLSSQTHDIDQLIDERTKEEALQRNVILDGLLAGWMAGDVADLKISLTAPDNMRFRRIARRERISYSEARHATLYRERLERRRFKRVYGINIGILKITVNFFDKYSIQSLCHYVSGLICFPLLMQSLSICRILMAQIPL